MTRLPTAQPDPDTLAMEVRSQSSASHVLPILQRSQLALAVAGLGMVLTGPFASVAPAAAAESSPWNLSVGRAQPALRQQVAFLPQLPPPPAPQGFAMTPERKALLNTIRYAEGTWKNGDDVGYRVLFGGSLFHSFDRHPDRVMYSPGYASAAAGAYQFMPFTWDQVSRSLGLPAFEPRHQDQAALYLIQRRGALRLADSGQFTPELAARLSPEWASFPTLAGRSYYGQPVKRYDDLRAFYEQQLAQLRNAPREDQWEQVAINKIPPRCAKGSLECQLQSVQAEGGSVTTTAPSRLE